MWAFVHILRLEQQAIQAGLNREVEERGGALVASEGVPCTTRKALRADSQLRVGCGTGG